MQSRQELALVLNAGGKNHGGEVSSSLFSIFTSHQKSKEEIESIARMMKDQEGPLEYFLRGSGTNSLYAKGLFDSEKALKALNAEYWAKTIELTDVLECMPAKERNEWNDRIHKMETPDFTRENVIPTIQNFLLSRDTLLARKADGLFNSLSGNHVTNSPSGFSKRMIIENVFDGMGLTNHHKIEQIHDLRSIISKLMGKDADNSYRTSSDLRYVYNSGQFNEWFDFDGGAFKVRLYKKGTVHMEIHPEIAVDLNNLLHSLHPHAIPASSRRKTKQMKEIHLTSESISSNVLNILADMVPKISRGYSIYVSSKYYDKQEIDVINEVLSFFGGVDSGESWTLPNGAADGIAAVVRLGAIPNQKSHQYYPTEESLARAIVDMASVESFHTVLEPSAGQGGLADLLARESNKLTCVEISEVNASVLKSKGHSVTIGNFLEASFDEKFDRIVMNPPFAKGQALSHVQHAVGLLTQEGKLVAILPASLKGKIIVSGYSHVWSDVIEAAFQGTNVRVVILTMKKDD